MAADPAGFRRKVSGFIADTLGLNFPPERWADLERGLAVAARESGFESADAYAEWLLSAALDREQVQALAHYLTIGETYFFREKKTFEALASQILPDLIRARRGGGQRLRLWSAGCCTGEEPYSLAILLRQLLPDVEDWTITILATDINAHFLRKAVAGVYGPWSFRDTPPDFKESYFQQTAEGRFQIAPEIQKLVRFSHLNLAVDPYPSLANDTNAMDLIFCRNVLMYFTPAQMRKVIANLHHALVQGGWLAVSPSEVSQALFPQFVTRNFPGAILYQRDDAHVPAHPAPPSLSAAEMLVAPVWKEPLSWTQPPPLPEPAPLIDPEAEPERTNPDSLTAATLLYEEGRYAEAASLLLAAAAESCDPARFSLLARALANQSDLAGAALWCERWIAADKLQPAAYYFQAMILLEQGEAEPASRALQRAIYLQPEFVLAHFALGNLARQDGKHAEAERYFSNTLRLLEGHGPEDALPESDGLTAGRLIETIATMMAAATP